MNGQELDIEQLDIEQLREFIRWLRESNDRLERDINILLGEDAEYLLCHDVIMLPKEH